MSESKSQTQTKTAVSDTATISALLSSPGHEVDSLESILKKPPEADQKEAWRILYGDLPETIAIPADIQQIADSKDFEIAAFKFNAAKEQRRKPRVVRIGVIQNQIILPTSAPILDQ